MTWHAKALTTSYVTAPGAGAKGAMEDEAAFPYTTTSWYFLDAMEMMAPADPCGRGVRRFHHRRHGLDVEWRRSLAQRSLAPPEGAVWNQVAVVNGGIGGNQVAGPAEYSQHPFAGGPSALQRLDRDVLSALRDHVGYLAGGYQRFQPQRQHAGRKGRSGDEGRRRPAAREMPADAPHWRRGDFGAWHLRRGTWLRGRREKRKALNQFIRIRVRSTA